MSIAPPSPSHQQSTAAAPLDPLRQAARLHIRIHDLPGGGKEFVLPALRNLRVKLIFSLVWLFMIASLVISAFIFASVVSGLPAWMRWFFVDHGLYALGILGLITLVLTIACLDMWLRSSRIVAEPGMLHVVTHWLIFKRVSSIPASRIIETKIDNTTTAGTTRYYDIIVLAVGDKPGWIARQFPARPKAEGRFGENEARVFNTGGRRISAATGIEGEEEAAWMLSQLRSALGITN